MTPIVAEATLSLSSYGPMPKINLVLTFQILHNIHIDRHASTKTIHSTPRYYLHVALRRGLIVSDSGVQETTAWCTKGDDHSMGP